MDIWSHAWKANMVGHWAGLQACCSPLGNMCLVFLLEPYPILGMFTPDPLNFRLTRESIPLGRLQDSCRSYGLGQDNCYATVACSLMPICSWLERVLKPELCLDVPAPAYACRSGDACISLSSSSRYGASQEAAPSLQIYSCHFNSSGVAPTTTAFLQRYRQAF